LISLGGKGGKIKEPEKEFLLDTFKNPDKPNYKVTGFIDKPVEYKGKNKLKLVDYKTNAKIFAAGEIDYNPQAFVLSIGRSTRMARTNRSLY
jgi:ATP-dependent exoDNAse (exonuclease V) beta subunit